MNLNHNLNKEIVGDRKFPKPKKSLMKKSKNKTIDILDINIDKTKKTPDLMKEQIDRIVSLAGGISIQQENNQYKESILNIKLSMPILPETSEYETIYFEALKSIHDNKILNETLTDNDKKSIAWYIATNYFILKDR